jgi:hypothetical protein
MARPAETCVGQFARAVEAKRNFLRAPRSVYASVDEAAAHRVAAAARNPGAQWISAVAARALVLRALEPAPADVLAAADKAAGWVFRHDPKIKGPSPLLFSDSQAHEFPAAIAAPVLLIIAEQGWPRPADVIQARMRCVRDLEVRTLPGSHHLHADPDTAPAGCAARAAFLRARGLLR